MEKKQRETYLEGAFKKISTYLDTLFGLKDKLKGFWIFKSHYSAAEIFSSPEYTKIESFVGKIGDDIKNWEKNGELDGSTRHIYNVNRDALLDKLDDLKIQIERREPTWWDKVKDFFIKAIKFITEKLPKMLKGLLCFMSNVKLLQELGKDFNSWTLPKNKRYF